MPIRNPNYSIKQGTTEAQKKENLPNIKVRINSLRNDESHIKAYASANIAGTFAVHGISVIEGKKGLFISMPQRSYTDENGDKKYSDIFHAVTKDAYEALNDKVLGAYQEALSEFQNASQSEEAEEILDEDEGPEPSM